MAVELTKNNCDMEVKGSVLPVVIDFWGPNCAYCTTLIPKFEEMERRYSGRVKFCKVDTSQNKRVAVGFKVMSLPAVLFLKGGTEVARLGGANATPEKITAKIESLFV